LAGKTIGLALTSMRLRWDLGGEEQQ